MDDAYSKAVGQNIGRLRRSKGLTQERLVARMQVLGCDITRSALAKIEAGQRHAYPDELKAFKAALEVRYEELFV